MKIIFLFFLYSSFVYAQRINYESEIKIKPKEGLYIKAKSPVDLRIENTSDDQIIMKSLLKIPTCLSGRSDFHYFLPKKGLIYLYNYNNKLNDIIIKINALTKKKPLIEKFKTDKIDENELSHYRGT